MPLGVRNPDLVNSCAAFGSQLCGRFFKDAFPYIPQKVRIFLFYIHEESLTLPFLIVLRSLNFTLSCGLIGLISLFLGGL